MFDPEKFGNAMGEAIRKAVEPLLARIAVLEKDLESMAAQVQSEVEAFHGAEPVTGPAGRDGKDCDMEAVKSMIAEAVKAIPVIHGKDGRDGEKGADGAQGPAGFTGADGLGLAGAMIDRDGALQITMTNGAVKNLGVVVGKDGSNGANGTDGKDGVSLESFDLEYLEESHEICVKASAAGRVKELRYPAGGIRAKGYWREGTKAKAGDAWVHDGSMWIAVKDCQSKPGLNDEDWIIGARKGRDGENGRPAKAIDNSPIKLGN